MNGYEVIKKLESKPEEMKPGTVWTAERVEEIFTGTGLGRKTFVQVLKEVNVDCLIFIHEDPHIIVFYFIYIFFKVI